MASSNCDLPGQGKKSAPKLRDLTSGAVPRETARLKTRPPRSATHPSNCDIHLLHST